MQAERPAPPERAKAFPAKKSTSPRTEYDSALRSRVKPAEVFPQSRACPVNVPGLAGLYTSVFLIIRNRPTSTELQFCSYTSKLQQRENACPR